MRRDLAIHALVMITILAMVSVPYPLLAADQELYKDYRGKTYTSDDLGKFLFQETKNFTPDAPFQAPPSPPPIKIAVALNVFFDFNSARVLGQYNAELDKLGQALTQSQYSTYRVRIEGHTDNIGSHASNQRLSAKRAESIKRYLVQHYAIAQGRLEAKGYGDSKPRATNDTQEGRDQNRRVEVVNLGR